MKKTYLNILLLITFFSIIFLIAGCINSSSDENKSDKDKFIGKWESDEQVLEFKANGEVIDHSYEGPEHTGGSDDDDEEPDTLQWSLVDGKLHLKDHEGNVVIFSYEFSNDYATLTLTADVGTVVYQRL